MENLDYIRFQNEPEPIIGAGGNRANAQFSKSQTLRWVLLSRLGARDWSDFADPVTRRASRMTLVHELAHNIFFDQQGRSSSLRDEWLAASKLDGLEILPEDEEENFAIYFSLFFELKSFAQGRPSLAKFYSRFLQDL